MTPHLEHTIEQDPATARPAPTVWAVAALATPILLSSLGAGIASVGLPPLARAFGASFQSVQWVVLAYLLATTTLIVGVGRLADLLGRRRLFLAGLTLFTAASVLCGIAPTLGALVAARAVQGLGAAVMATLAMALVGEVVPTGRTGRAMGVLGTMSAVGTALGPSLGGVLIAAIGWRGLFLVNVPLGALALFLAQRHLPRDSAHRAADSHAFDFTGMLLLAAALAAYSLATTVGRGRTGAPNVGLLLTALLAGLAFVRAQARAASPLVNLSLLHDDALGANLLTSAVVSTVVMATLVVGPFYLSRGLDLSPVIVGAALSVGPLVTAVAGVPAGRAADRFRAHRATLAGLLAMATGSVLLAVLPSPLGIAAYVIPVAVVTLGYAVAQTANNAGVMTDVRPDQRGLAAALLGLSRNLGLITGASAMGAVFSIASGGADVARSAPIAVAVGMRVTFAVAAGLVAVAFYVTVRGQSERHSSAAVRSGP